MAILSGDVKLLKSAVMADVPEGGGAPTGLQIADGVSNSIFPDISELDRAGGRVSLRKTFVSIQTDDTDTYFGGNVIVAEPPEDPRVSVTLFTNGETFDTRAQAQTRIEAYLNKGAEWAGYLYENHIAGQRVVQLFQRPSDVLPNVGQTLVLVQDEGLITQKEQYVRVTSVSAVERTFTIPGSTTDYKANVVTLEISDALRYDFTGSPASRTFTRVNTATKTRDTVVADAGTYVGVVPLTSAASIGDFTVAGSSIYTQLVPSAQTETPIVDIKTNGMSEALVATGDPITRSLALGFTTTTNMHVGGPIYPGSLSVVRGAITLTDSGGLLVNAGAEVGTVDYDNGILTLSTNVFGTSSGTHSVTFTPAALPEMVSNQNAYIITAENRSLSYVFTIDKTPLPKTLSVSYLAQGRWYVLRDVGNGVLKGQDAAYGAGTVNYTTGSVVVTLGALPDVGSSIVSQSYSEIDQRKASNTLLLNGGKAFFAINSDGAMSTEPGQKPIAPGSVSLAWTSGGVAKLATDNGLGVLSGDATGVVDYSNGVVYASPTALPAPGTAVLLDLTLNDRVSNPDPVSISNGFIGATNIVEGSVSFHLKLNLSVSWDMYNYTPSGIKTIESDFPCFDSDGVLYVKIGNQNLQCGTINYLTGVINVTLPTGLSVTNSAFDDIVVNWS